MRRALYLLLPLLTLGVGCGASINEAYKADIDRRVAGLHHKDHTYPAVEAFEPMPLAVGQWIELKMVDDKQQPSFLKYSVVGQEGDAYWLETSTQTYYNKSDTRMLIAIGDRSNPETYEVRAYLSRINGKEQHFPPGMLGMLRSLWKPIVHSLSANWQDLPREDARVTAGDFQGCFKRRATVSLGRYTQTSEGWAHPSVPINGLVRSVGIDKPINIELVAFGTEGAKSAFTD